MPLAGHPERMKHAAGVAGAQPMRGEPGGCPPSFPSYSGWGRSSARAVHSKLGEILKKAFSQEANLGFRLTERVKCHGRRTAWWPCPDKRGCRAQQAR